MKQLVFILILMISPMTFSQVGINVGMNGLLAFGNPKPYGGFHIGAEIPRNERMSYFARISHMIRQKGKDSISLNATAIDLVNTTPNVLPVKGVNSLNYTTLEGGTLFYIGNGFDYGFAGYGGTGVALVFSQVKTIYEKFDESKYRIDGTTDGSIFSIAVGARGGVKYSFPRFGTLYFEADLKLIALSMTSTSGLYAPQYKPLLFGLTLGYRKDILW